MGERQTRTRDGLAATVAQRAVHHSLAPTFVLDAHGIVSYANPAALEAFGYDHNLIGCVAFVDLLDQGSLAKGQMLLAAAEPEQTTTYELNQITGERDIMTVCYRAIRLDDDAASDETVLLIGELLAPAMATTERLIELNQRLNALFKLAASASQSLIMGELMERALDVAVGELRLRAAAVFMNDHAGTTTELPTGNGGSCWRLVHQQGFTAVFERKARNFHALTPFADDSFETSETWVREGSIDELGLQLDDLESAVGPHLSLAVVPLQTEQNVLGCLYVVADRYRAFVGPEMDTLTTIGNLLGPPIANTRLYAALLEKSGQLQAVLDGIDGGVLLVDRTNVVRYANQRLGVLLGENVAVWPGQARGDVLRHQLVPLGHKDGLFGDNLWLMEQPTRRILRKYSEQIADPEGTPIGEIEVYSDVTEAEEMNQLKEDFIAAAAHDLKTPVTAVKGYAQIALRRARRLEETRLVEYLEMIDTRSDELTFLMDSLLDVSRIQAGHLRLHLEGFDLAKIVHGVEHHFDFDLQRKRRELRITTPPEPQTVRWDRLRIERVLVNLVGNALKYAPDNTPIHLDVRQRDDDGVRAIEFAVTDYGVGIPVEERERVFERFYRMPQSVADNIKGSGLGLYICRRVVQEHAGRIWIADNMSGEQGTTVYVVVPQTPPFAQDASTSPP